VNVPDLEGVYGVIRAGIVDAIQAQLPIHGENDPRPEDAATWATWVRRKPGVVISLDGPLDIERAALDIATALAAVLYREDAGRQVQPQPVAPVHCAHCGMQIERTKHPAGKGWRHMGSGFLMCSPELGPASELAEP
jgi:hypothetical protein